MKKQKSLYGCVSDMDIHLLRVFQRQLWSAVAFPPPKSSSTSVARRSAATKDLETRLDLRLCARPRAFALTDHGRLGTTRLFACWIWNTLGTPSIRPRPPRRHPDMSPTDDIVTDALPRR